MPTLILLMCVKRAESKIMCVKRAEYAVYGSNLSIQLIFAARSVQEENYCMLRRNAVCGMLWCNY